MSELTNYIKERIENLQSDSWENSWIEGKEERIAELQAVLSKIEDIEREEKIQARGEAMFNDRD